MPYLFIYFVFFLVQRIQRACNPHNANKCSVMRWINALTNLCKCKFCSSLYLSLFDRNSCDFFFIRFFSLFLQQMPVFPSSCWCALQLCSVDIERTWNHRLNWQCEQLNNLSFAPWNWLFSIDKKCGELSTVRNRIYYLYIEETSNRLGIKKNRRVHTQR